MFEWLKSVFKKKERVIVPDLTLLERVEQKYKRDLYDNASDGRYYRAGKARTSTANRQQASSSRSDDYATNPLNPMNPVGFNSPVYYDSTPSYSSSSSCSSSSSSSYDSGSCSSSSSSSD